MIINLPVPWKVWDGLSYTVTELSQALQTGPIRQHLTTGSPAVFRSQRMHHATSTFVTSTTSLRLEIRLGNHKSNYVI